MPRRVRTRSEARQAKAAEGEPIPLRLDELVAILKDRFGDSDALVMRTVRTGPDRALPVLVAYLTGLINVQLVADTVLSPLLSDHRLPITRTNAAQLLRERLLTNAIVDTAESVEVVVEKIMSGRVVVVPEGSRVAVVCDVSETPHRAIQEPATEGVARGPHEGFIEHIETNLALLRRRLRTPDLRIEWFTMGRYTKTRVALAYIDGVASPAIVEEARRRLSRVGDRIDGVMFSETVAELIEDHPYAAFPTINSTERPERVTAALLEGRFAVFVEGSPFVLFAPTFFPEYLTSGADYAERSYTSILLRIVRIIGLFTTLWLPSVYVALAEYHPETIPTPLLLSIALSREGVPFPPLIEAFIMEGAFEILREAGLRLPRSLGNAVSIVGVLVVGQAAVMAGIVSPILIIIVGLTAVASFTLPNFATANLVRLLRFPILVLTGMFGALGIAVSFLLIVLHVVSLRSFGAPFMSPLAPFRAQQIKKAFLRHPAWAQTPRPPLLWPQNPTRKTPGLMPHPSQGDDGDGKG